MRKKFSLVLLLTTIFTISLTACTNQNKVDHTKSQTKITSTPTLFFHGGGSSYHAEEHMVAAAEKAGVTNSVIRAEVAPNGKFSLSGSWKKVPKIQL